MSNSPVASAENARHALLTMWTIRRFEEAVDDLFARGLMHGTMHLSIGQEALSHRCLPGAPHRRRDHVDPPRPRPLHRQGRDLTRMMAELLGKETGYCRGRGGSMHIADTATGNLGANGIVAGGIPIAAGAALAYQMRGQDRVVASFFGDGATNEGAFHEALNLAAIWKLPVVFICENNKYGMSFSTEFSMAIDNISERGAAYGMPGVTVDGNDVEAVDDAVQVAVDRARAGEGPTLVENLTYRWKGHSKCDKNLYRTREEIAEWRGKDPILRFEARIRETGLLTDAEIQTVRDPGHRADPRRRAHRQRRTRRRPDRPPRRRLRHG